MLRKTLIALSAAAALGVSSGAMAASHGGHGASGAGASAELVPRPNRAGAKTVAPGARRGCSATTAGATAPGRRSTSPG